MLVHYHRPVCLSFMSTDLPILSTVEAAGTIYQREKQKYHVVVNEVDNPDKLLWLEISPYRVIMTMQERTKFSYRHFWEQGVYGMSRYWLEANITQDNECLRLRNYTRSLHLTGNLLPETLRIEYELWSDKLKLGHYILHLDINH